MKIKFSQCHNKEKLDKQINAITGSGGEITGFKIDYKNNISTIYYILPIWISKEEFNLKLSGTEVYSLILS